MSQVIPDKLAKKLWIATSLIAVSTLPFLQLTVVDYAHWNIDVANQTGALIVAWVGSVASVLGLSRFAPTANDATIVSESSSN